MTGLSGTQPAGDGPPRGLALFDLDGTLIAGDSDHAFGEFMVAQGWVDADLHRRRNDEFYRQYQAGTLDIHAYIDFTTAPWRGQPLPAQAALSQRFMREVMAPQLLPAARALLHTHRAAGDLIAIVTATNEFITRPIADALGVDHLLAVQLVVLRPDRAMRADLPVLAVLAGLAAALCSALAHITVRKAMAQDSAECVVFWFTVVVSGCALIGGLSLGEFRGLPAGLELFEAGWKIAGVAGLGLAGQLLMTRAYGKASAPTVAMVAYAAIPMSIGLDLLSWGVLPNASAVVGSLVMVGAGLLLVRSRES